MRDGLVSWSVDTLFLALVVIGLICALYVAFKAFQQTPKWGAVFLLGPGVFYGLSLYAGWLIAGLVVIASQFWFVRQPYNWKTWGRIYVYMVLCWAGATTIIARENGWVPVDIGGAGPAPAAQAGAPAVAATESHLAVEGGRIWYRRTGSGGGTPVVLVHGGPGTGSVYLRSLEALGDERPVVRYDQLGAGRSDRASDTALFAIPRYVRELDSLRSALGFERIHVVGHGWGALVAFEYARARAPRVASVTLAGPVLSMPAWMRHTRRLLQSLPDTMQRAVSVSEAGGDYDSPDYQAAVAEYAQRFVWRRPVQADLDSMQKGFGRDAYYHMWGPSDFTITGTLYGYDATRQLRTIKVPVLYTVGEHDQADTATVRRFAAATPGAKYEVIPNAAHFAMWDRPQELLRVLRTFLRSVEAPPPADSARPAAP
jgi:proline iminopeptidase